MKMIRFVITSLFAFPLFLSAQKFKIFKDHWGLYYRSLEDLRKQKSAELFFYNFQPGETVASIGAQCCHWEAAFAAVSDSVQFYLEDIDPEYFNERQASFAWKYYDSIRNKPMTSGWKLVLGDEKKTNLPDGSFDKILIINSFHEFTYKHEMLADIARKLKSGGILCIDETLARRSGELHGVCKKQIYLDDELISVLKQEGWEYVKGVDMKFRKSKPVRKIFAFRKLNKL
jgi:SAM-dependent methyltransferase